MLDVSCRPGQLLIASRHLVDPNFLRTVVLLVQMDKTGVIGLILNRPLEITVSESCGPAIAAATGLEAALHQGGPCPGPLMVLHNDTLVGGEEILPGVRFTVQRDQIEALMRENHGPVKYFANYAGWGIEQLETELNEGAWLVADASPPDIFSDLNDEQWSSLMTKLTLGQWIDPDELLEDPSVN